GLHYKLNVTGSGEPLSVKKGVVDYLHSFVVNSERPESLDEYLIEIPLPDCKPGLVRLMPAGAAPSAGYWKKLAQINWHDLFYRNDSKGIEIFVDLKNRISDELQPDFLLIDSRTGITEMGGIATSLLPDKVICLVLPSFENLEGSRAVLRSLKRSAQEIESPLDIIVALSRLPQKFDYEESTLIGIKQALNEESDSGETLDCGEIFILHSEPALQTRESLRVGSSVSADDSVLLRDYLRLFANIVPRELIQPKLGKFVEQAKEKIWQDADAAVKELEELAESFGHPETYRALLHFYVVRNISGKPALRRAERFWQLSGDSKEPALWTIIKRNVDVRFFEPPHNREWMPDLRFLESVWRDAGRDLEFLNVLVFANNASDHLYHAGTLLLETVEHYDDSSETVIRCLSQLNRAGRASDAETLIDRYRSSFGNIAAFVEQWARHAIQRKDLKYVEELSSPAMLPMLQQGPTSTPVKLLIRAGKRQEASAMADDALRSAVNKGVMDELYEIGRLFEELGRYEAFERIIKSDLPEGVSRDILESSRLRLRRRFARAGRIADVDF
ncbi:MAG: hypothetical protein ACK4UN_07020, partial [Limisphaerales bacterium]